MPVPDAWWNEIGPELQQQIDGMLRTRRMIQALVLLRGEGGLQPQPSLYRAQELLVERSIELDQQGLLEPERPPPTTAELIEKADAIAAPIVAVEAVWDGDSYGWCVDLFAIVDRPGRQHDRFDELRLTMLRYGGDIRLFNGQVPRWPVAQQASERGQAVAQHFGVPFHFASPHEPDDRAPRWWDTQPI